MKKFLLNGFAFTALAVATIIAIDKPVLAADMPVKAAVKAPVYYTPVYNWTGSYIGINLGGGWLKDSDDGNQNGFLIGGTLGYNFQPNGPWVWGIEGDLGYFSRSDQKYLGTLRGRVGYANDRFLPYITGGLAVMNDDGNARAGWTVGAGLEYVISRDFSMKGEYLYIDPNGSDLRGSIVRAGFNWRY